MEVEREVAVAYVTALRHALKDILPSHRLLDDKTATAMFEQFRAAAYAKRANGAGAEPKRTVRP